MAETLLVYGLHEIPESLTRAIPSASPVRDCLFWAAHPDSALIEDLFEAIPEPPIEDEDVGLALALTIASAAATTRRFNELIGEGAGFGRFAGGFHTAGRAAVEPWLRERAELRDIREVLDGVLILQVFERGEPFEDLSWKPRDAPDDDIDLLDELYESPGLYGIERADPEMGKIDLVFDVEGERRMTLEVADHPDLVLEIDAENPESALTYAGPDFDFD